MIGVYGANGFIGSNVIALLVREGLSVRAISRKFSPQFYEKYKGHVDIVSVDFRNSIEIAATLHGLDAVVQLISTSSPGLGNYNAVEDISENVIPHVNFIRQCVEYKVAKFIFMSSGGTVYGPPATLPINEECPTIPINSHGITKLTVENYLRMHGHVDSLNYTILRLANAYGPGQVFKKGQGLIPAILQSDRDSRPIKIFGGGTAKRDYIYIDDVAAATVAALRGKSVERQTINVGSGMAFSVMDIVHIIEKQLGRTLLKEFVGDRATDVAINYLDISKAKRLLDWSPTVGIVDGLQQTIAFSRI